MNVSLRFRLLIASVSPLQNPVSVYGLPHEMKTGRTIRSLRQNIRPPLISGSRLHIPDRQGYRMIVAC